MQESGNGNLWTLFRALPEDSRSDVGLGNAMRHYDHTVNIRWVMAHYHAAEKYIGGGAATGGSPWQRYMHPRYQKRIFFPGLWTDAEKEQWGIDNLEGYQKLES